jgi:hypothetical protein
MIEYLGKIDENDLQFVRERYGEPAIAIPAPWWKNDDGSYKSINPHESRFIMEDGKTCSVFHVKPIYYAHLDGTWRPLSEVASYFGNKRGMTLKEDWGEKMDMGYLVWYIKRLEAMKSQYGVTISYPQTYAGIELTPVTVPLYLNASPLTAYPDPNAETNTVDGEVVQTYASGAGQVWATIKTAGGSAFDDSGASLHAWRTVGDTTSTQWVGLERGIFLFLTSSIGAGQTITSATLSLCGVAKYDDGLAPTLNIYSSAPASNTVLAAGDFDSLGSTAFCDTAITYADFSTVAYNVFTLNLAGRNAITTDGVSKFGTRDSTYDAGSSTPTWSSEKEARLMVAMAETALTTSDPKLVVNYEEAAAGPANLKTYNTNVLANIKSINTNLIANIKSLNTNV